MADPVVPPEIWLHILERYGIAWFLLTLVVLLGFALVVRPLVKSHKDLIATLKENNEINTQTNKTNSENLTKLTFMVEAESKRVTKIEEKVDHLSQRFDGHVRHYHAED